MAWSKRIKANLPHKKKENRLDRILPNEYLKAPDHGGQENLAKAASVKKGFLLPEAFFIQVMVPDGPKCAVMSAWTQIGIGHSL
jgi:hypothetical protein